LPFIAYLYKIQRVAEGSKNSAVAAVPAWTRLALPSATDLIFVALLFTLVLSPLAVRLLGDAGIGWHIRTGQQILATHTVPHADPFSSTMQGKPWFAWEWIYDLVVGQLEASLGLNGVVWFSAVVIAAVFAAAFRLLILRGTNLCVALLLYLLAVSASTIHFLARPHLLSWLFTLIWFYVLDSSERESPDARGRRVKLWLLPLLMLVWVNVHGGFLVGFVLLAIFWLGAVWEWSRTKGSRIEDALLRISAARRARALLWAGLLSAAASLLNPYGWKLHEHVYSYLANRFLMEHIDEFRSPDFHGLAQKCFLILLLLTLAGLAGRGRELRMSQVLTLLFAVYAGLYATRNIPISSLLLALVVGPLLSRNPHAPAHIAAAPERPPTFFQRMSAIEAELRGHLWPVAAIIVTFCLAANGGRAGFNIGSSRLMDAHFGPKRMPVAAVDYLEQHELKGPVLAPDYWGGYLIYRLYPKTLVVLDDRHDLYGAEFFKSYLKLIHAEPGWDDFLRTHHAGCVLLPLDAPLSSLLVRTGEWKAVYTDEVAIAFVREPASHAN